MPDRIKQILDRIVNWWKKFNTKQKMIITSITAVMLLALIILAVAFSRPTWVELVVCENTADSGTVKELLEGENIDTQISDDGLTFKVKQSDEAAAKILLGSNDIYTSGYSIEDALDGGFSSTESDKSKKYQKYLEDKLATQLETISGVEEATVSLNIPEDDGTILASDEETYAGVALKLSSTLSNPEGIASFVATALGNTTTENVQIIDEGGSVLFSGTDETSSAGTANSQYKLKSQAQDDLDAKVQDVALSTEVYDSAKATTNLVLNFDETSTIDHQYSAPEGSSQGMLDSESSYEETTTGASGGTPGTDANDADGTTYVIDDGSTSSSTITDTTRDYLPNESITTTKNAIGAVEYESSSVSLVLTSYEDYDEEQMEENGELDGTTFDEFVAQNRERVRTEVDQDYYAMVADATGIPEENISIIAYQVPRFHYAEDNGRSLYDYLQIALAVIILALLGYVVFRSTRPDASEELEPELSVETLLESTKEAEEEDLEDIGYNEKSETRILIEKFVDENPEAVASLLRNWLNEEWE